jgi:hypothetical protein
MELGRLLKNKHQVVSQGVRRFGKRSLPEGEPEKAGDRAVVDPKQIRGQRVEDPCSNRRGMRSFSRFIR